MSVVPNQIGSRIRDARHSKGWTQSQLATAVGTRERNIIRWENDQHEPRAKHVAAIAVATGKDLAFFFAEDGGDDEDEEAAMRRVTEAFVDHLLSAAMRARDAQREGAQA